MSETTTTERVKEFLAYFYNDYGWFSALTGISASKWRDLDRGKTKGVTAEMIDELCRVWPEFAYWFVTGKASCTRGQTRPDEYLDVSYGTVRALEGGTTRVWRDQSGLLCPEIGNLTIENRQSKEWEVSIADRILHFSALVSGDDAEALAPLFWAEFFENLPPNEEVTITVGELKTWINRFPLNCKQCHEVALPSRNA